MAWMADTSGLAVIPQEMGRQDISEENESHVDMLYDRGRHKSNCRHCLVVVTMAIINV